VLPGRATLQVGDNGPGISDEALPHLFDPFFTTKDVGQGLGLGLSISYGIVRNFGGSIRAGNSADGGAVFRVELPLAKHQATPHDLGVDAYP
jgi:two-component system C4-dicarboxylate transport sensor histidine kinase DctB